MNVRIKSLFVASFSVAFLVAGCATTPPAKYDAVATLAPASGSQVSGSVSFRTISGGLHVDATVAGLSPGDHGFHVHEVGDCSAADATSAKGHFNPFGKPHGKHDQGEHHSGDMPNLAADSSGKAMLSADIQGLVVGTDASSILGRAVIVHADPDDYKSQPAGNAGKRIACGVIKAGE